jgi:chemotaxis protein histidine kinase CheA
MRRAYHLGILGCLLIAGFARGEDAASAAPDPAQANAQANQPAGGGSAATPAQAKSDEESKLPAAVREALERNAQEIKALKDQYARDKEEQQKKVEEQRKKIEDQQKQIETLERSSKALQEQLAKAQGGDLQKKLSEIQQKQLRVLEEQSQLVADQLEKQGPAVEKLQTQAATLASRSKQGALRDQELANAQDALRDTVDGMQRNPPWLPAPLKELFLPSGTNVTPISIFSTVSTRYDVFQNRKGAGYFQFEEFTPFFLVQLNKRMLLSAETSFTQGGVALGQAQLDIFLNDWLTADVGYFLAPIGFWSERLDPRWINKLPDIPLVMRQVIPDGLTLTGLQFRGARYLFGSPFKLEYSAYATNGLGVPGMGQAADWYDLAGLIGTTGGVNSAMAYGARLGIWVPTMGINFGVSEFVNAPYGKQNGAVVSVWQPYFNYHRGNWDVRFEYGQNYEETKPFIGTNINRTGLYAQVAYRDYQSIRKHLQRLEYVFRFSDAMFHGINQNSITPAAFSPPSAAPVDRNQYTLGVNYYLYASSILKFAYEFNDEVHRSFRDNVFMMQFATNF